MYIQERFSRMEEKETHRQAQVKFIFLHTAYLYTLAEAKNCSPPRVFDYGRAWEREQPSRRGRRRRRRRRRTRKEKKSISNSGHEGEAEKVVRAKCFGGNKNVRTKRIAAAALVAVAAAVAAAAAAAAAATAAAVQTFSPFVDTFTCE